MQKTHKLRWPITLASGEKLNEVSISTVSVKVYQSQFKEGAELLQKSLIRALISIGTGLSDDDLKKLRQPDYNKLAEYAELFSEKGTDHFIPDIDPDNPKLLVPIKGNDGKEVTEYSLECPTVETTDLMDSYKDDFQKNIFLAASCSGLSPKQIESFSTPDWLFLLGALSSFLDETADYFHPQTVKP